MADDQKWFYQIMLQVSREFGRRSQKGDKMKKKVEKVVAETLNINLSELQCLPGKVLDCVVPSRHPVTQGCLSKKGFLTNQTQSITLFVNLKFSGGFNNKSGGNSFLDSFIRNQNKKIHSVNSMFTFIPILFSRLSFPWPTQNIQKVSGKYQATCEYDFRENTHYFIPLISFYFLSFKM